MEIVLGVPLAAQLVQILLFVLNAKIHIILLVMVAVLALKDVVHALLQLEWALIVIPVLKNTI